MDGVFANKKLNLWLFLLMLCGILFIGMYIFLNVVDPEATSELLIFLIIGVILCAVAVPPMFLNRGAYIHIENGRISAKYYWVGRLNCDTNQVSFALAQPSTLTIVLKNGKRHVIMGVENSWALASAIRKQTFSAEAETVAALQQQLVTAQDARKKDLYGVIGGIVFMFAVVFVTVLLTGGRDLHEFSKLDWTIFVIMIVTELVAVVITFYIANRCGKQALPIDQTKHRILNATVLSAPLPPGNAQSVYTDEHYAGRVTVCYIPNSAGFYYCVEVVNEDFTLETVFTSEVFEDLEELDEHLPPLIDITSYFLSPQ